MKKPKNFAEAIRETLREEFLRDDSLILMGLGVNDPKGVFGTTLDLYKEFGKHRVIETPTSENAMLGVAIGLALAGHKVVSVHQRLDFFLLAMDQLINGASKWNFMFGNQTPIPITIRLVLGRGWGQGPTHSQNLHALFTHLPGVKVVMPSKASEVGPLLSSAINDPNPVIFLEDRWLHLQEIGEQNPLTNISLSSHSIVKEGRDFTIIASGFMTIESLRAAFALENMGISAEVIDLRTLKPIDIDFLCKRVSKTRRVLIADSGPSFGNYGKEISYLLTKKLFKELILPPIVISSRDDHEPTSHGVIREFKVSSLDIAKTIANIFGIEISMEIVSSLFDDLADVPNIDFRGPF